MNRYNPNKWYNYQQENQIYYIVYLTTNLVNKKIYVGVHSTLNLNDGYLGSGTSLKRSIKKYGRKKFSRTILHCCVSLKDALFWERCIVDTNFVNNKKTYNIDLGGMGGTTKSKQHIENFKKAIENRTPERKREIYNLRSLMSRSEKNIQHIKKITKSYPGDKNGMAAKYLFINPDNEHFVVCGKMRKFLNDHGLSVHYVRKFTDKGKIKLTKEQCNGSIKCYNLNDWEIKTITPPKNRGTVKTEEQIRTLKNNRKRQKSPSGKKYTLTSKYGDVFIVEGRLVEFAKEQKLSISILRRFINKGTIFSKDIKNTQLTKNTIGWEIKSHEVL